MCGRFALYTTDKLQERFNLRYSVANLAPNYNASPGQYLPVIIQPKDNRVVALMNWGLVPSWAKDPGVGTRLINSRAETVMTKPTFRHAFQRRRCLVPANGFFEWAKLSDHKKPYYFRLQDRSLFAFAGLWEQWMDPFGSEMQSFLILTTRPNALVSSVHDRMPVILKPEDESLWLDPTITEMHVNRLFPLLQPYSAPAMTGYPVSNLVNTPKVNSPDIIKSV